MARSIRHAGWSGVLTLLLWADVALAGGGGGGGGVHAVSVPGPTPLALGIAQVLLIGAAVWWRRR